jgi:hypothetical protein
VIELKEKLGSRSLRLQYWNLIFRIFQTILMNNILQILYAIIQ